MCLFRLQQIMQVVLDIVSDVPSLHSTRRGSARATFPTPTSICNASTIIPCCIVSTLHRCLRSSGESKSIQHLKDRSGLFHRTPTTMSAEALPIDPAAFAEALESLPVDTLHERAAEIRNSINHLKYSNEQMMPFADDGDEGQQYLLTTLCLHTSNLELFRY